MGGSYAELPTVRIQRVVNIAADDESDTRYNRVTEKTVGGDIYRRVTLGIQMKRLRPQNLFITCYPRSRVGRLQGGYQLYVDT